jgi:hypothetical protein
MLRCVAFVLTDVSEELSVGCWLRLTFLLHRSCHPDDGGAKFLRNVGSYKSHTA